MTQTSDTDPGSGEQWGRAGGRTLSYTVADTSGYAALSWGAVAGTAPSAAFDNNVNPAEILTFDPASNLAGGVARWIGSALLPLANGTSVLTPTRFTLTVTNGTGSVPLSNITGGAAPGIDVKTSGSFSANLLFEAQWLPQLGGGNQWVPILDFYDLQPTPPGQLPGQGGPVLTSFERGFYFTAATSSMTLEEHDANITGQISAVSGQLGSVKDDTAFLRIDTVGRFQSVQGSLNQVQGNLGQLTTLVQSLPSTQIPPDLARRDDVNSAKNDLMQVLMILFGLAPCPDPNLCETATLIPDLARQASVDDVRQQLSDVRAALGAIQEALDAPSGELEVQVVELDEREASRRRRWLVRTSVNGSPAQAELAGLIAIGTRKRTPATTTDVTALATVTPLMPGLMDVVLHVGQPNLTDLAFQFNVRHATASAVLHASTLVSDVDHK